MNMKKIILLLLMLPLVASLTGCFTAPVVPPFGNTFTMYSSPIDVTLNTTVGDKEGRSTSACILGLISYGDAGLQAAAEDGGITRVDHIGYEMFNVLGIFMVWNTVVYGD
jgi:hypothetical protein